MEPKKILGIDLGVASIGWAILSEDGNNRQILGMGSRIIPLSTDDKDEFSKGNAISKNQKRTQKRTQRKGYDRYQLRRMALEEELLKNNLFDKSLIHLNQLELWGLRARAVTEKISLLELGRILYHLNQKRGYKSSRSEANMDKKDTDYVEEVKNRHQELKEQSKTIGQKFYLELQKDQYYTIKQKVYPRESYIDEFDAICKEQQKHYPEILTNTFILKIRDEIIYYQRKLKSQKGLVNVCDFEGFRKIIKDKKELFVGPKVAPKSSPLFQICKIWETINNINLKNKWGASLEIPIEKKREIFNYMDNNEKLSQAELYKILELNKNDGWYGNKMIEKGLQGNLTKTALIKILDQNSDLLQFKIEITEIQLSDDSESIVDLDTGEVIPRKIILPNLEKQPLYDLWHTIYSISDLEECKNALIKKFSLEKSIADKLAKIDFTKSAFGNKSVKAMRKILPYLMDGYGYSDACSLAGYNHSNSLIKDENLKRKLVDTLQNLPKNSLRQPVVEKILNQLINIVNAIILKYGKPDEIRVELARELKQSKDERNQTYSNIQKIERENEVIRKKLQEEYNLRPTRKNVIKWRLFHEINGSESKINATCIYCGQPFGIHDALSGSNVDIEHIIPKSLIFDDSQNNKTLSHRACNEAKGNKTAYDFMQSKGESESKNYIERVDALYKNKIIRKTKRDKLLMTESKIPDDFIERQIRETQYISRKSKEILEQVCRNVWSTSGTVTAHLRRVWGWDDVLMNLQLKKYREIPDLTYFEEIETSNGQILKIEKIKDWSKRDDHRHHAIDALAVACTKQGFIQRINNLNSKHNKDEMYAEIKNISGEYKGKLNILDNYLINQKPFTTKEVEEKALEIMVSFKPGKKAASFGKRKIKKRGKKITVQTGIIVPRGALSEESVYGKIKTIEKNKPVKYLFENPHLIYKSYIKALVEERLEQYELDTKKALSSLNKEPIFLDDQKSIKLEYGTCFKEEYVIKYPLNTDFNKADKIIDEEIKSIIKERLSEHKDNPKEAFKDLENNPVWYNKDKKIQIKSIRCSTGLTAVEPIKKNEFNEDIAFVKPGNNHHIAFYIDENGIKQEHLCSFWHAVERKKYGIPVVIENPKQVWDLILSKENKYPQSFLDKLPDDNWKYEMGMQQNEMFIMGMQQEEFEKAISEGDKKILSNYLYIIWSLSQSDYWFRHHLETKNTELKQAFGAKDAKRFYRCQSISAFEKLNPKKIRINNLGDIVR